MDRNTNNEKGVLVLISDNEPVDFLTAANQCSLQGVSFSMSACEPEMLERIEMEETPDLILLDIMTIVR